MADEKKTPAAVGAATDDKEKYDPLEGERSPYPDYSTMPSHCQVLTIMRQEYDILRDKALRYDMLRDIALKSSFVTDTESVIFGIHKYGSDNDGKV